MHFVNPFDVNGNGDRARQVALPVCMNSMHAVIITKRGKTCKQTRGAAPMHAPLVVLSALPHILDARRRVSLPIGMFTVRGRIGGMGMSISTSNNTRVDNTSRRSISFMGPNSRLIFFGLGANGGSNGTALHMATRKTKGGISRAVRVRMHGPGPTMALHRDG